VRNERTSRMGQANTAWRAGSTPAPNPRSGGVLHRPRYHSPRCLEARTFDCRCCSPTKLQFPVRVCACRSPAPLSVTCSCGARRTLARLVLARAGNHLVGLHRVAIVEHEARLAKEPARSLRCTPLHRCRAGR
jgi:hypothetical protein